MMSRERLDAYVDRILREHPPDTSERALATEIVRLRKHEIPPHLLLRLVAFFAFAGWCLGIVCALFVWVVL